jgi:hypothetical protein
MLPHSLSSPNYPSYISPACSENIRNYILLISPLQMLLRKCANQEPSEEEELEADKYTNHVEAYSPVGNLDSPSVSMSTAIALVNRYALGRDTT